MSKKQFHKLILHFVLTLAAIVVLLIAVVFFRGLDCLEIGRTVAVVKGGYYVEA